MTMKCNKCFNVVESSVARAFRVYGRFVARHPWKVIIIAVLVNGLLGVGMMKLNKVSGVEKVYVPMNSQASQDEDKVRDIFPDLSGSNYRGYQSPDVGKFAKVIVRPNTGDIMDTSFLTSVNQLYTFLTGITTTDDSGNTVTYSDICAKKNGGCSISGDLFVDTEFSAAVTSNTVAYPFFSHSTKGQIYYEQLVAGATVTSGNLQSATMLSMTLNLRTDTDYYVTMAEKWQDSFLEQIETYTHSDFTLTYRHADSLSEELSSNVSGDIGLFSVTFTLMITYACFATLSARCDVVGQRGMLGMAGVLPAGLGIVAAFGLCSVCGVEYVSIVGVIPFLIIGIGVDDMFLLMSGMTETNYDDDVETRIGDTMATSGVSITITSLTDVLAFAAGASSIFLGVRNFCIFAGVAVVFCYLNQASMFLACLILDKMRVAVVFCYLNQASMFLACLVLDKMRVAVVFCYLNQASMFLACLAINERRTLSNRHFVTCKKLDRKSDGDDDAEKCKVGTVNGAFVLAPIEEKKVPLGDERPTSKSEISIHNEKDGVQDGVQDGTQTGNAGTNQGSTRRTEQETTVKKDEDPKSKKLKSSGPKPSCSGEYCSYLCCTGRPPRNQDESESHLDRLPRWLIPKLVTPCWAKAIVLVLFAGYLGVSIWGVTQMKQGLDTKNLVSDDSYVYKFEEWAEQFPGDTIVSFVFNTEMTYSDTSTKTSIDNFIAGVKADSLVRDDFEINWVTSFEPSANRADENSYVTSLQAFLASPANGRFENDVVIDTTRNRITGSRIHLISETLADSQEQGKFMLRMRELADNSGLSVFAFSPAFLYYEQYVAILPQTLQTVGIAIAMVFFVTILFMPHPLLLIYITLAVVMITVGVFGFLEFVGLTLSSITMIHLVMSIGFSVDFTAHICHGYMISGGKTRNERMVNGICRSGAPIFHGAMSSLLGVLVLAFANSYIFFSFFKVMSLVVLFGIGHALLLLPVILSLIGPATSNETQTSPNHSPQGSRTLEIT